MRVRITAILLMAGLGVAACETKVRPDDRPPDLDWQEPRYGDWPASWNVTFDDSEGRAAEPAPRLPRFYRTLEEAFPTDGKWWTLGYRSVGRATLDIPVSDLELADPRDVIARAFQQRGANVVVILRESDMRLPVPGADAEADFRRMVAEGFVQDPGAPEISARHILQTATKAANKGDWPLVGNLLNPDRVRELGVVEDVRPSSIVPLAIRADYEPLCVSFAKLGFRTLSSRQLIILFRASRPDLPEAVRTQLERNGSASIADAAREAGAKRCSVVFERARFMGEPRG